MNIINIGLCGANGRMGQAISKKINESYDQFNISSQFTRKNTTIELDDLCKNSDVVIDFSSADMVEKLLEYSLIHKTKLVIGTTGLKDNHFKLLTKASEDIAILYSPNMTVGANLITLLAAKAANILGNDYDVEILDSHHRLKKDAPSGTAIMLGKSIAAARNLEFDKCAVFDRSTKSQRLNDEIGFACIRGGSIYGEHDVFFVSDNEIITIKHQALNRESFADGSIKAANWLLTKQSGLYSMIDVLNF
jgi:4-hydroxy-tetrahydrodipicolinate reductase